MTMSPESVLRAVNGEPSTVTTIYRRREELLASKSLTKRQRRRRSVLASVLEELAAEGRIQRGWHERWSLIPTFWR